LPGGSPRRAALGLAALLVLAALVRFVGIGAQSFWLDEVVTAQLVQRSFGDMLSTIPHSESTPYLYYVLVWPWAKLFGHGEAALRSLSALFGVATVAAIWAAARELVSERAALAAGALAALNPFLVWYSQEARAYALLALLCAGSFWLFARALRLGDGRALAWWALASALALATHYFAAFTVVPEAIALALLIGRTRAWALACGGIALATAALAPLAAQQRRGGGADWIGDITLGHRISEIPKRFAAGEFGNQLGYVFWLVLLCALAAVVLLGLRASERERRGALVALGIGLAGLVVPVVSALATLDYVFPRNLIGSLPALLVAFGAALTVASARRAGGVLLAAVVVLSAVALVRTATDDRLQRDDWRSVARFLDGRHARILVTSPQDDGRALSYYMGGLLELTDPGVETQEVAVVELTRAPLRERRALLPVPGFRPIATSDAETYRLVLERSPRTVTLGPGAVLPFAFRPDDAAAYADLNR